ncbi:MAG: AMP-binding protein [Thermodesulfobacteriota bacterium]|nr:AMP-binding protein [Thermodesulfobacteriota bacterium]
MYQGMKKTLADLIDEAVEDSPKRLAIIFNERRIVYEELGKTIDWFAMGLIRIGVSSGEQVAILMSNRPQWLYSEFGVVKAGCCMVPVNIRYRTEELKYILNQSKARTIITMDKFLDYYYLDMLREIAPEMDESEPGKLISKELPYLKNIIAYSAEGEKYEGTFDFNELINLGRKEGDYKRLKELKDSLNPDDMINIPFTSGTTGHPKGVMTSHAQLLGVVNAMGGCMEINETDRIFMPNPFFFNLGNITGILMAIMHKACLLPVEVFDPGQVLKLIAEEKCTMGMGFAQLFIAMVDHPDSSKYMIDSLKKTGIGFVGVANPTALVDMISKKFGVKDFISAYGMTECSGCTSCTKIGDPIEKVIGTVGKAFEGVEVKIIDPKDGEVLPPNQSGELCVRGYIVMKGYYMMPEETREAMDEEGWFHTGDMASIDDDGYLKITGRLKDMIKVGGISIFPAEVEVFLDKHPKIKLVEAVGVPDKKKGEAIGIFIQLNPGVECAREEIDEFCKGKIADFKIPKYIEFVDQYPLSPLGKVQKFKLRDTIIEKYNL